MPPERNLGACRGNSENPAQSPSGDAPVPTGDNVAPVAGTSDRARLWLAEIPSLAAEVELTRDHPNPGSQPGRYPRQVPGSRPPTSIAALHAALPDGESREYTGVGLRGRLGMCARLIVEEMTDAGVEPPSWPDDEWAAMAAWLASTASWWQAQTWEDDIRAEIRRVWVTLRGLARVEPDIRLRCTVPGCGAIAAVQAGGTWLACESGHQLDIEAERMRHWDSQTMTLGECRRAFLAKLGVVVSIKRLAAWHKRGDLTPIGQRDGHALFSVGDVYRRMREWEARRDSRSA